MSDPVKITPEELLKLSDDCMEQIRQGKLYELRNNAKLRAVYNTQSYEEFKGIVDAAHMTPITRQDKMNAKTRNHIWNTSARDE